MAFLSRLLQQPFWSRQKRQMDTRASWCLPDFLDQFEGPPARFVAELLWEKLREVAVVPEFRPKAEDSLLSLYGLAEEELDEELILALATDLGMPVPSPEQVNAFGPISTVADAVRFLTSCGGGQR